jgi:Na+/H+ antiporter NhaD and related arsenite permeases
MVRARFKNVPIWAIMAFAAFIGIAAQVVNTNEIETYVDWDVILFLIGMFSIAAMAEESGLLEYIFSSVIYRARTKRAAMYLLVITFGLLAAIAVNDAVAAMGSIIAVPVAKALSLDPELVVLVLAFSVTIGSTMTPIGNPQNMLIAVQSGVRAPLTTFLLYLAPPTIVNLVVTAYLLDRLYGVRPEPL